MVFPALSDRAEYVTEIISPNEILDMAVLKIQNNVEDIELAELAYFPMPDMYLDTLKFQSIGYMSDNWNRLLWINSDINNPVSSEKWDWELSAPNVSLEIKWKGYSGSPVYIRDKCFAIVIYKVAPHTGTPLGAVSVAKLVDYLKTSGIQVKKYANRAMLEREECFTNLLEDALTLLKENPASNYDLKENMLNRVKKFSLQIREMGVDDFELIINSIKTPFDPVFKVDSGHPSNIKVVSDILSQLVMLKVCKEIDFSHDRIRSLKIQNRYISYLYSSHGQSYINVLITLYKALLEEPLDKLDDIACILVGNDSAQCLGCSLPYNGANVNMDFIVSNISKVCDRGELDVLTNLVPKINNLPHHCKNCINFWDVDSLGEISDRINGIVKE